MTTTSQPFSTAFTAPSEPAVVALPDSANAKNKLVAYLLSGGQQPVTSIDFLRRLTGVGSYLPMGNPLAPTSKGLAVTSPTTATNLTYRQCPNFGLARNLVSNGGTVNAHGMTLAAQATVIADSTSPSAFSLRTIATASAQRSQWADQPIEAGKAYSVGLLIAGDGTSAASFVLQWVDGSGNLIGAETVSGTVTAAALADTFLTNQTAPGNARTLRVLANNSAAGIFRHTCLRVMQQTTQVPAWTSAHQQFIQRGVSIYEASTNLAADGDMEAVGVASWTAVGATLTKDTTNPFAGTKRLKVANTGATGQAEQTGALAAGQSVTASVRCIGGDAGAGLQLVSMPSVTIIGSDFAATADYTVRRVSGVIAGGDSTWRVILRGGSGVAAISYFDNLAVENKAYDTMNADPSGLAFNVGARPVSDLVLPRPSAFDPTTTGFAMVVAFRPDHDAAVNNSIGQPYILELISNASSSNDRFNLNYNKGGTPAIQLLKIRNGVSSTAITNSMAGALSGDTINVGIKWSPTTGLTLYTSRTGASVVTVNVNNPESLLPIGAGTVTVNIGRSQVSAGYELDGTVGIVRILKDGLTDAQISAIVSNPYGDPTDNDLSVWLGEGQVYSVPVYDDMLAAAGVGYDYQATIYASSNGTSTNSQPTTNQSVSFTDWWLMNDPDRTKSTKIDVIEAPQLKAPLPTAEYIALGRDKKIVEYGPYLLGDEGTVKFFAEDTAYTVLQSIKAIAGLNQQYISLKAPNGMFWNVKPRGVNYTIKENGMIEGSLDVVQVAAT